MKDRLIGGAIMLLCLIIAAVYLATLAYPSWLATVGLHATAAEVQFWIIAVPVTIAFVGILAIGAWIGWTMATTPPPKPTEPLDPDPDHTGTANPASS